MLQEDEDNIKVIKVGWVNQNNWFLFMRLGQFHWVLYEKQNFCMLPFEKF